MSMKAFLVLDHTVALDLDSPSKSWDGSDQDWFYIDSGVWVMRQGIIWDGATAVWDGAPDPANPHLPALWLSSLVHDLGYMFMDEEDFPYTRREIDVLFNQLMKRADFPLRIPYYLGVRWFGGIWNSIFDVYRRVFRRQRELPAHLSDYLETEISYIK